MSIECQTRLSEGSVVMNEMVSALGRELKQADGQMRMAAECIESRRLDEARLHLTALATGRSVAIGQVETLEAKMRALGEEIRLGREARLRAAGMGALLSEIIGKGALSAYGDSDLVERVAMAVEDHDAVIAALNGQVQ